MYAFLSCFFHGPLDHWTIGPLVHWSIGPLVKCQMSKIKNQMSIRLNFCRSVPPEFLRSLFIRICIPQLCAQRAQRHLTKNTIFQFLGIIYPILCRQTVLLKLCICICMYDTSECKGVEGSASGCKGVQVSARVSKGLQGGAWGCKGVQDSVK